MSPEVVLFALRLVSALVLLAFFALAAWLLYRDLKVAAESTTSRQAASGTLTLLSSDGSGGEEFVLQPITSIGRSAANTLVIEDDFASSEHVLITLRGQQWWIEDLGSRNGTMLNEILLETAAVVTSGDVITAGRTRLRIDL
jgi:pSer/pThr/pTyr-binding forkhead associated (FHA) protein